MARPSKIHAQIQDHDPTTGKLRSRPITDAIVEAVSMGVYPTTAAQANGIHPTTLANWRTRAAEFLGEAEQSGEPVPEEGRVYVEFLDALTRAEARGLMWHELNVRKVAGGGEGDGRLSLEFLARRHRAVYARELKVEHGGTVNHEVSEKIDEDVQSALAEVDRLTARLGDMAGGGEAEVPRRGEGAGVGAQGEP